METEIPTLPSSIQRSISPKINDYRISFEEMRKLFSKCEENFRTYIEKKKLFAESEAQNERVNNKNRMNTTTSDKEKLIQSGKMVKNQGAGLKEANKIATDTEQIVYSVQNELKKNKESLQRTLKTVNFFLKKRFFIIFTLEQRD